MSDKNTRNELKAIYKKLDGNINENSMLLYSGPRDESSAQDMWMYESTDHESHCTLNHKHQVGCIYTGDSDFKGFQLKNIYSLQTGCVGVVQVPHHGSSKSFDINALEGLSSLTCPVSYGTKNSHEHPEISVINALSLRQFAPILISEKPSSQVIQRIYSK